MFLLFVKYNIKAIVYVYLLNIFGTYKTGSVLPTQSVPIV